MGEMKNAGIVAVSDDGRSVPTSSMMRRAMEYATATLVGRVRLGRLLLLGGSLAMPVAAATATHGAV